MKSLNLILLAIGDMIECFPTSMKNLVSRKHNETNDKLTTQLNAGIKQNFYHTEVCSGALKVLSKMFLLKDKRSEAWCFQITKIVDSINGFWAVCRPIDAEHQEDSNLEKMFEQFVSYKFLDAKTSITLDNSIRMMKMLFALLKFTLNHERNEPHFVYGSLRFEDLLECIEGIVSQPNLRPKGSTTAYLGLNVYEFNVFLTHCKINALELLRQLILSFNMVDYLPWIRTCMSNLLHSEDIMQSNNLLYETLETMKVCVRKFKFGFGKIALSLLLKSQYIIHPSIIQHALTLMKTLLLRQDKTIIRMNDQTKLKAGLLVNESNRDLAPEYANFTTKEVETRLHEYLSFLHTCVDSGIVSMCSKADRAMLDSRLYTLLQLSHFKFSPLKPHLKLCILDIAIGCVKTQNFVTHNKHILSGLLQFVRMAQQEPVSHQVNLRLNEAVKIVDVYAGNTGMRVLYGF